MSDNRKSVLEIVLMPSVLAIVGAIATHLITQQQITSAQAISAAQLQASREQSAVDQHLKILDIFKEKIASNNQRDRVLALRLLRAVDTDLAFKLSDAVADDQGEDPRVRSVAEEIRRTTVPTLSASNLATTLNQLEPGKYVVVVASTDTREQAEATVRTLQQRYPPLFEPVTPLEHDWGKGYYQGVNGKWAVYIGGMYSRKSAIALRDLATRNLGLTKDAYVAQP